MATTMEDIFPNIFANINQVSISRGTFIKWSDKLSGSGEFIENVTKTSDSVHDELGHEENNPKPKDWEDEMILFTKLYDLFSNRTFIQSEGFLLVHCRRVHR